MIVKIQRPLGSNEENPPALVYNESHSFETMIPMAALEHLFGQANPEVIYHKAKRIKGGLQIGKRVAAQPW